MPVKSPVAIAFGAVLKELRDRAGLKQQDLANACGLHVTYIGLLERGVRQPSLETVINLAKALAISPATLVNKAVAQLPQD